jgi:hypothetical protein
MVGEVKASAQGMSGRGTVRRYWLRPDQIRVEVIMPGMDMKEVIAGNVAYRQLGGFGSSDLPPTEVSKVRRENERYGALGPLTFLLKFRDPQANVCAIDQDVKYGIPLDVVGFQDPGGERVAISIDRQSHFVVEIADSGGQRKFDDWRNVGNIKYPYKVSVRGARQAEIEVQEVKINSGLSADLFKR